MRVISQEVIKIRLQHVYTESIGTKYHIAIMYTFAALVTIIYTNNLFQD